jgi:hypothetical protein
MERERVTGRLQSLLAGWSGSSPAAAAQENLDAASDDDLFDMVDKGFGVL